MGELHQRLDGLLARVIAQAQALSIPVSPRICPQVTVNRRARARLGCCRGDGRGGFTIELSAPLCQAPEGAVCQVLAHEVLHTCPGCANHGPRWKQWAQAMNQAYGYRIRRADDPAQLGIADPRPARYLVVCRQCGRQLTRMRRSPLVDHPERYRCPCGGRLEIRPGPDQGVLPP